MMDNNPDKLTQLIDELGPVDPPAGLTGEVMAEIARAAARPRARVIPIKHGGIVMT